jgi:hypothetical protein
LIANYGNTDGAINGVSYTINNVYVTYDDMSSVKSIMGSTNVNVLFVKAYPILTKSSGQDNELVIRMINASNYHSITIPYSQFSSLGNQFTLNGQTNSDAIIAPGESLELKIVGSRGSVRLDTLRYSVNEGGQTYQYTLDSRYTNVAQRSNLQL